MSEDPDTTAGERRHADEADPDPPPLRRRLLGGYRPADVRAAIAAREEEIDELRRDIAALWLAFGQHERAIRGLAEAGSAAASAPHPARAEQAPAEASSADEAEPGAGADPGERTAAGTEPAERRGVHDQLADLDQVLAAIEQATRTLERTYADEIAKPQPAADEPDVPDEPAAGSDAAEAAADEEQ